MGVSSLSSSSPKYAGLLVVTDRYPSAGHISSIFVKEQVDELRKYFATVYVIALVPWVPRALEVARSIPYVKRRIQSRWISDIYARDYSYGNVRVKFLRALKLPFGVLRKRYLEKQFENAIRFLRRNRVAFDIIHAHFTLPSGYVGLRIREVFDVPVILTIHEEEDSFRREMRDPLAQMVWRGVDAIIRVSRRDIDVLRRYNRNVYYIPNGFSRRRIRILERSEARKCLGIPEGRKVIFSLGYISERKGFQYLVEAMRLVLKKRKDILCFIGGRGPLEGEIRRMIKRLGLEDSVRLLGFIPEEKLCYWYSAADVFVLPSLSEGNPTVMFEALGAGLPVIVTDVGGAPDVIVSEDYGFLVRRHDPEDLAEKILVAISRSWDREKILRYAENFTWGSIAREIFTKIYSKYLDAGS